jgi:hypothetical protein
LVQTQSFRLQFSQISTSLILYREQYRVLLTLMGY